MKLNETIELGKIYNGFYFYRKKQMDTQPLIQYIAKYIDLSEDEIKLFLSKVRVKRYLKGQYVVQSGDVCRYLSFVLQGSLKSSFTDPDGKEHIVMLAIEDWWIGDLGSFSEKKPADFDIQCLEKSFLAQISKDQLDQLFIAVPKFERFFRLIILRSLIFSQRRLVDNFSLSAKERYLKFRGQYPKIEQRVPQYLIASYLGITKEFLSKIRNELADSE